MSSIGMSIAESAFSGAIKSISPFTKEKPTGNINWGDYNYPPCLAIVHYDPDDIQNEAVRSLVIKMNRVLVLTLIVCCLNMFDNIIDAALYPPQASWHWVVYSGLNLTVIPPIALYIFYNGYKALALNDSEKLQRYSVFATIQAILYFLFTIMPFGATNGLLSFAMFDVGVYWAIAVIVESSIWAYAFAITLYSVIFVVRGDYMMLPVTTRVK